MGGRLLTICGCLVVLLLVGPRLGQCQSSPTDEPDEGLEANTTTTTTTTVAMETTTACNDRGDRDCPNPNPSAVPPAGSRTTSMEEASTAAAELGSTAKTGEPEHTTESPVVGNTTADESVAVTLGNDTIESTQRPDLGTDAAVTNASDTISETTTPLQPIADVNTTSEMGDAVNTTVSEAVTVASNFTEEVTDQTSATMPAAPTIAPVSEDPCIDHVDGTGIHYKTEKGENCTESAVFNISTWTHFQLNGTDVSIPTEGIKSGFCGARYPYRIFLDGGELPAANSTADAYLCTHVTSPYEDYCDNRKGAKIYNCDDKFYVYKILHEIDAAQICAGICLTYANERIDNENLADPPPTTSAPEPTTEEPEKFSLPRLTDLTESQENGTVTIEYKFPENEDENNVTAYWAVHKDEKFRSFISRIINKCVPKKVVPKPVATTQVDTTTESKKVATAAAVQPTEAATTTTTTKAPSPTEAESPFEIVKEIVDDNGEEEAAQVTKPPMGGVPLDDNSDNDASKGPSRRAAPAIDGCAAKYTKDDVFYVYDTPQVVKGILQISFVVTKLSSNSTSSRRKRDVGAEGDVVSSEDLFAALNDVEPETHEEELDLAYVRHYEGKPVDPEVEKGEQGGPADPQTASIWDAHMGLFIAIIILIILCILVVIIGILCIKCKGRKYTPEKTPLRSEEGMSPMVMENPITDEEIVKGEAPMTESQNPAYTPNGSGHHLTKGDEENGWIVPLDELTYAERERPEVDNTRL